MYEWLTDCVVVLHLLFIVFVVGGALLAARWRWLLPIHLCALAWGVHAELAPGVVCPLTALENTLAQRAGLSTYQGDFVARYLVPVIYQEQLGPGAQAGLALAVVAINVVVYALVARRWIRDMLHLFE